MLLVARRGSGRSAASLRLQLCGTVGSVATVTFRVLEGAQVVCAQLWAAEAPYH